MPVPMIDLRAQYRRIKPDLDAAVAEVFETQGFVGGPNVEKLEEGIASYLGAGAAIACASGTDALLLSLKALGIGPGDEVITTPFTFFATAGAIANVGAKPVFADIRPRCFTINPECIEPLVTPRTKAIIPVHLYGQCADMEAIHAIAARHGLTVIEDAAQALGAKRHSRPACTLAPMAAISFYPTKNLGGAGDGGMVIAQDAALAERVRLLRAHGAGTTYIHAIVGTNSRLDALQAAVLNVKRAHLDEWNAERRARAAYYTERFAEVPEVTVPVECPGNFHVYHQYVIRLPRRDEARDLFRARGVGCAVFYPLPLHLQECFRYLGYSERDCPHAVQASREVLALPMFPELTPEQQDEVVALVKEHLAGKPVL
ncbi:MAG TPA: DegT/DnrJ/EryC1/StrS family aminotransferase [Candidatus Hydrogenedentes bacterium]|nr:DegT/DnrJ/EryC1/StrS family aminotransferase [Candidatus Hydrogenedentota bacterium]HRT19439.1 DegT/DnrJ/EryC1/StrS family aminotransferase [Candidatus Hydrogenedentota bacterium]HRT63827.1 DegT/DnrJ/EryC1/StrS family aminotransferase [Candidatus Hydrogenedentota bacterium]